MRSILVVTACAVVFAAVCLAETFKGKLIDASCAEQQQSAGTCSPTPSTTAYAIDVSGKVYRLDADGNTKATEAVKNRAERASDPNAIARTDIRATVKGTLDGGTLKVESIEVQ
jgi:hypothetical protein